MNDKMFTTDQYGREWRFSTHKNGEHTVIQRGRKYQISDDGGDQWRWYWDADSMVAVYDDERNYTPPTTGEETDRARRVVQAWNQYGGCLGEMLDRLARRIMGNYDARFIAVPIDRGVTLYALSYDGDPDNEWCHEIEALACGDVWRIEVEEFDGDQWVPTDDTCEEWYGEDKANEGWIENFPLDAFPADLTIADPVGA